MDPVRAERVNRDGGANRRIDAAGHAKDHAWKTVFIHVIA